MTYLEMLKADVKQWMDENKDYYDFPDDRDELAEFLEDKTWVADSVTGNASGSYYCNSAKAKEQIFANTDEVVEALTEMCDRETIAELFIDRSWEYMDVTARCYWLGQAIDELLDEGR